jgi:hypothetical protein
MKTLTYFPNSTALNSKPVLEAFLDSARSKYQIKVADMDADVAVIWSCLWAGRMAPNKEVYEHFRSQGKPVIIIEVGALKRNITWKIAVNNITSEGHYGHTENLDWNRPRKLGVQLQQHQGNNGKILIAAQHHKGLQLQHLESQEQWIQQQVDIIKSQTDRDIIIRSHPRSPLLIPSEIPRKITGTYDDYNFDARYYCIVNYSSGPGIQAAIQGTPVITSELSLAHPISNNINKIRQMKNRATEQWLTEISHCEYLVDEIQQGLWLTRLEQWV